MAKPKAKAKPTGKGTGKAKAKGKPKPSPKRKPKPSPKPKPKSKSTPKPKPSPKPKPKPSPTSRAAARPTPRAATEAAPPPSAADIYTSQVADIIRARPRESSTYRPVTVLNLSLSRVRAPQTVDELTPAERAQLAIFWHPMPLEQVLGNEEFGVEVAEVVDGMGTLRYRLYGWNYGVGYLMPPQGMDVIAFASQHDIEHWDPADRDLFVAMDNAMRLPGHGFQQPLSFCWWDDDCWAALAGKQPGTVGSEPHLRQTFAAAQAALAARAS